MGNTCFPGRSRQIVDSNSNNGKNAPQLPVVEKKPAPTGNIRLVNTISFCYDQLSIHFRLLDEAGRAIRTPQQCSYQSLYRNVSKEQTEWSKGQFIKQFPGLVGRYCILEDLIGGDIYEVKTQLVSDDNPQMIKLESDVSTVAPLKSIIFLFCFSTFQLF